MARTLPSRGAVGQSTGGPPAGRGRRAQQHAAAPSTPRSCSSVAVAESARRRAAGARTRGAVAASCAVADAGAVPEPPERARAEAAPSSSSSGKALKALAVLAAGACFVAWLPSRAPAQQLLGAATMACAMALGGFKKRSLSASGAAAALAVGALCLAGNAVFGSVLLAFFVTSSALTKWGAKRKAGIEDGHKAGGQRDWLQVAANGAVPTLLALWHLLLCGGPAPTVFDAAAAPLQTALACAYVCYYGACAGDTWASEVGVLSKGEPILITTLRRCARGTNGGVSLLGTLASAGGGLACGATALAYALGSAAPATLSPAGAWLLLPLGVAAGVVGSLIDSLLGATIEYSGWDPAKKKVVSKPGPGVQHISGLHWLSGNMVNFASACATAALGAGAGLWLM